MFVRRPAVAGQFYEANAQDLMKRISECFLHSVGPGKEPPSKKQFEEIIGIVSPHAGLMYSGPVAAHGYYACSALDKIDLAVILGPNHWGVGSGVATVSQGIWVTPLGKVEVDSNVTKELVARSKLVDFDDYAHKQEHSLEVQIPFLQCIFKESFKILPVTMFIQDKHTATEIGGALYNTIKGRKFLLVASSDFTHYENQATASSKDHMLIDRILKLDVEGFYDTIEKLSISVCGYGPIAVLMAIMKQLGGNKGKLLKYATSGDITKDYDSVVGYASIIFTL